MAHVNETKLAAAGSGGAITGAAVPVSPANAVAVQFNVESAAGAAPASPSATAAATGGTQAIATYFYQFSAINSAGLESAASTEVHSTITTSTGSTTLSWSTVSGSASYRVYRGTTASGEANYFTTTTGSFTDDGSLLWTTNGTSGTPLATTPTVTWKVQGGFDGSNWFDMPWISDATATESQATVTLTSAGSRLHWLALAPARFFSLARLVTTTSVASQLTYNATIYEIAD